MYCDQPDRAGPAVWSGGTGACVLLKHSCPVRSGHAVRKHCLEDNEFPESRKMGGQVISLSLASLPEKQ